MFTCLLSQFPGFQEILALGFTGGNVVQETGEVCVLVTPRIGFIDEFWRWLDRLVEGKTVQGSNGDSGVERINQNPMKHTLVSSIAKYLSANPG